MRCVVYFIVASVVYGVAEAGIGSFADNVDVKKQFEPTWDSLNSRPVPRWFRDAKFGIMLHWGVFSVPAFSAPDAPAAEWYWKYWNGGAKSCVDYMKSTFRPDFTYQDFAQDFKAEFWQPDDWAKLFQKAGAKYIVLTTKHHEGYTMWPSTTSFSWNSMDVGPKRDLVGELAKAIDKTDIVFGVYHSLYEWFNPLYLEDKHNSYKTDYFIKNKVLPEQYELVTKYRPKLIWSDGDWEANSSYWKATELLAWLYNESPVKNDIVVNDRWGSDSRGRNGGYYTCHDRYNPLRYHQHKWENVYMLDRKGAGFSRTAPLANYLSDLEIVTVLAQAVCCNGNLLLNIGPSADGTIDVIFQERLTNIGKWLDVNGEAVFGTEAWIIQNQTDIVWYTAKCAKVNDCAVYAILLSWPSDSKLNLVAPIGTAQTTITMLGVPSVKRLPFTQTNGAGEAGVTVDLSPITVPISPSSYAWVLKLEQLDASQQRYHPGVNGTIENEFTGRIPSWQCHP